MTLKEFLLIDFILKKENQNKMDKINEIRDKQAKKFGGTYSLCYPMREVDYEMSFIEGFDAAMDLQLPVLFADWKDKYCMDMGYGYYFNAGCSQVNKPLEDIYKYWLENIYSPEKINTNG